MPRKTKHQGVTHPRIKISHHPHVSILRHRTEKPEVDDAGILIPQTVGRHVMVENYRAPRTSPTFKRLRPEDLWFPLTPLSEWEQFFQEGVGVTDALLTLGEILIANDKSLGKWGCKPSVFEKLLDLYLGLRVSFFFLAKFGTRIGSLWP
jgi:hypothetical protein